MKKLIVNSILLGFGCSLFFILGCKHKNTETKHKAPSIEGPKVVKSSTGVAINYTITGKGDHALIFVHGWSCNQTYWAEQVAYFKNKYQVITLDLGGHGKSGSNRGDWSMMAFGTDVLDVINQIEFKKLSIIGHSMGSVVVMDVASRIEKKPHAVVFVDYFKDKPNPLPTREQVVKRTTLFKADFANNTKKFVRSMFLPSADSVLVNRIVNDMSNTNPEVAVPAMIDMTMTDVDKGFKTLMSKNNNAHLINSDARATNKSYFDSLGIKVHTIPETSHFLMIEKAKDFNLLLEDVISNRI